MTGPSENLPDDHSSPGFDPDAFCTLVSVYLDGEPSAEQLRGLNETLVRSQPARKMFVHLARVHGLLTERAISRAAEPFGSQFETADAGTRPGEGSSLNETVVVPAIRDGGGSDDFRQPVDLPDLVSSYQPPQPPADRRWWIAAAATGLAAVLMLAVYWGTQSSINPPPRVAVLPASQPAATAPAGTPVGAPTGAPAQAVASPSVRTGSPAVAVTPPIVHSPPKLLDAIAVTWADPKSTLEAGDTVPGGPISLATGWIKIGYWTGTTVVIEAPAKFQVVSDMKLVLTTGRVAAVVPPAGHGFTVQAPFCSVVDLGTDFGVSVDAAGRNGVSVFKGSVQLDQGKTEPATIREGAGRRIDSAAATPVPSKADPDLFVRAGQFDRWAAAARSPGQVSAVDRWRIYTEQLSRDPSLKLLYTFDGRPADGTVLHNRAISTAGNFDLPASDHDPDWTDGRLPGLGALEFHPDQMQRLLLPTYPMTRTGSMTVATWVYARTAARWGGIVKSWGDTKCGALHLGLSSEQDLEIELDGKTAGGPVAREGQPNPFPTGRWVFVAFVTDGKKVSLYRDGQIVAEAPSRPIPIDSEMKSLAIGFKTGNDGVEPLASAAVGYWDGKIGDFAMFDRALAPAEILRMYQAGRP